MEIINKKIDHGKAFDWGRTSDDYAKYRDIYQKLLNEISVSKDRRFWISAPAPV